MRAPPTVVLAALFACVCVLPAAAPAAPDGNRVWHPHVRAAKKYIRSRDGDVSFAVRTPGRFAGYRAHHATSSASVVKAMLMVAYLNQEEVRGRELEDGDLALLDPMIRRSSNRAANQVYGIVGSDGLYRLARRVGMRNFTTMSVWGASQITAADQTKFFLRIERYVAARHRHTALRLLGSVVGYQRWGIAQVRPQGWALYFKGGWTPVVQNQVGLYRRGERRVAIAVLTYGSKSLYGRETERGVALRLLRGLGSDSVLAE